MVVASGPADLPEPSHPRRIFANRNLRLDTVRAIGFDMDYTLARYRREKLERLAYTLTIEKLIRRGYPESIRALPYDPSFVVRGLTVDKQMGNILKLDRHNHAARAFHGRRRLTKRERRALYRRERIRFVPPRFAVVDTLFSLPEMCLYANLIDFFESCGGVDPWQLFEDTRECIDEAHRDNSLKSQIRSDLSAYVDKDPLLARTLHKLRSSGKKLFVLTNSYWAYTNDMMTHLLAGELPEYPSWRNYFEFVVVGAQKPLFFTGDEPLAEINADGDVVRRPAGPLKRGGIYQGGNLKALEAATRFAGETILYVGDHIYGDILHSKKSSMWRTALIVEELEDEIARTLDHQHQINRLLRLEERRRTLDDEANAQRRELSDLEQDLGADARTDPTFTQLRLQRDQTKRALKQTLDELKALQHDLDETFNPSWGRVFKEDGANSRFADQVVDHACVYTSRVSNFFFYSAYQYFRSARDLMPHERWSQDAP